jgi:hypothetical protein
MGWPWVYFCEFLQFSAEILQKPTFGAGLVRIPSAAEIILRATASVFAGRSLRSAPAGIRGVERVGEAEGPQAKNPGLGGAGFASESESKFPPFRSSSSSLSEESDAVSQESTIGSAFFL